MAARLRASRGARVPRGVAVGWIASFIEYCRTQCHLSENTVAAYRRDLAKLAEWLFGRDPVRLTIRELADYASWLHARLGPGQHRPAYRVAQGVLSLSATRRRDARKPGRVARKSKVVERVPRVLSIEAVDLLLAAPVATDGLFRRDRALLEMLYATGCRASEVSNLALGDIHLDEAYCLCRGKGDRQRIVPLGRRAIEAIRKYLEGERPQLVAAAETPPRWLLLSRRGQRLRRERIWELMKRYAIRSGRRPRSARTRCGTASPRIWWQAGPICGKCRKCSGTPASRPRKSTPTSTPAGSRKSTANSILGRRRRNFVAAFCLIG